MMNKPARNIFRSFFNRIFSYSDLTSEVLDRKLLKSAIISCSEVQWYLVCTKAVLCWIICYWSALSEPSYYVLVKQFITFLFSWGEGSIIANFVSNFVAMVTGVGRGKMQLAAFDGIPENPPIGAKILQNLLRKPRYSQFCPKFHCLGNQGGPEVKLNDTIRLAKPENYTLEPKITTLSYTQPELWPFK